MNSAKKTPKIHKRILVTAGPTVEPLDPVRFLSNYSTGTMGYAIAAEGARAGFEVCLISGPVRLSPPPGVETVNVTTAREMRRAVLERVKERDCLIMAAAVCDFRPETTEENKIKKKEEMTLKLVKNPDILQEIGHRDGLVKVGFALETENPVENGRSKLKAKELDLIVINTKNAGSDPFGPGEARYTMMDSAEKTHETGMVTKKEIAESIIGKVGEILA